MEKFSKHVVKPLKIMAESDLRRIKQDDLAYIIRPAGKKKINYRNISDRKALSC